MNKNLDNNEQTNKDSFKELRSSDMSKTKEGVKTFENNILMIKNNLDFDGSSMNSRYSQSEKFSHKKYNFGNSSRLKKHKNINISP